MLKARKMGRCKHLSDFVNCLIVIDRWVGQSISQMAGHVDCFQYAVVSTYKKWTKKRPVNRWQGHGCQRFAEQTECVEQRLALGLAYPTEALGLELDSWLGLFHHLKARYHNTTSEVLCEVMPWRVRALVVTQGEPTQCWLFGRRCLCMQIAQGNVMTQSMSPLSTLHFYY